MRTKNKKQSRGPLSFKAAFDVSIEVVTLEDELKSAVGRQRRHLANKARRMGAMITPPKRQNAAENRREILGKIRDWIDRNGPPKNVTTMIKELRDAGALVQIRKGKPHPISDTTMRELLRTLLGVNGKAGRRPNHQKP